MFEATCLALRSIISNGATMLRGDADAAYDEIISLECVHFSPYDSYHENHS